VGYLPYDLNMAKVHQKALYNNNKIM